MDTVARISEISASSSKSFDDAINIGIARAVKTLKNVEGAWVQDQKNYGDSYRISVERLMGFLTASDQDVEIITKPRQKNGPRGSKH
jgi:dodecin